MSNFHRLHSIILTLAVAIACSDIGVAQSDCDTFLGSIRSPENNCAPCTNGMERLMYPLKSFADAKKDMDILNQSLRIHLEAEQANIDRLAGMQKSMNRRVYDWGLGNLSGHDGPSYTDPEILQQEIEEMEAFARRFPETQDWLNAWKQKLQSFMALLNEAKQLEQQAAALAQRIRDAQLGNLSRINFDCCPSAREDGLYADGQTATLQAMFDDYDALLQRVSDMRTRITDEGAQFLQMLKALLAQRSGDEQEAIASRDQFSAGLTGFISAKIGELISSGLESAFNSTSGQELTADQRRVLNELSQRASGQLTTALSGGGVSGMTAESIGNILRDVASGMSENDREALALIGEEVFAEIGSHIMDKIIGNLAMRAGQRWLLQGLGAAALPIELLNQLITVPLYLWEDKNRMILQEAYDLVVVGLVKCIQLSRGVLASAPFGPIDAYLDRLELDDKGRERPIEICLPPAEPPHADANAMLRAFFRAAFPGEHVNSLHDNERAEMVDGGDGPNSRYLNYIYNNQVRFHVRFGCYCGVLVEKTAQSTIPPPWSNINLLGERMKPGYPFAIPVDKHFPWLPVGAGIVGGGVITAILIGGEDDPPADCTFSASAQTTNSTCGQPNGATAISVSPTDAYSYQWSNGSTSASLTNLSSGTYTATVTRTGTTCSQVVTTTVQNTDISFAADLSVNSAHCGQNDGSAAISVNPFGFYTYAWSNGGSTPSQSNLASGAYTVTVSLGSTCTEDYQITIGELPPEFEININATPASCGMSDGSAVAVVTKGDYDFVWSDGSMGAVLEDVPAGEYSVTVTIAGTSCQKTSSIVIGELPPDFVVSITSTPAECGVSEGTATATVDPPGNYEYLWSEGTTGASLNGVAAGDYSLTVTLAGTSCQVTSSTTIEQLPPTFAVSFNITQASCSGSDGSVSAEVSPAGNYDFIWSTGNTTPGLVNIPAGEYQVTVTRSGTTCAVNYVVQVPEMPADFTFTINTTPAQCGVADGTASVVVDPPGTYTFQWSSGPGTPMIEGLSAGTYVLSVTDENGCLSSGSFGITETPADFILDVITVPGNCLGDGANIIIEVNTNGNGPIEINATGPDGLHTVTASQGSVQLNTFFVVLPGAWHIVVHDRSIGLGCTEESDVVVEDNTTLLAQEDFYQTTTNQPVSGNLLGNDMGLHLSVGDHTEPTGGVLILNPDGSFTFTPPADVTGEFTFQYQARDTCGNTAITNVVIQVNSAECLFDATFETTGSNCGLMNGTITTIITPPGTYTYVWSNGESTQNLINLGTGDYSVTITSVDLVCNKTFMASVGQLPVVYISNVNTTPGNCTGEGDIIATLETPGSGPLVLVVSGPEGVNQFTLPAGTHNLSGSMNIPSGDYSITVYDESIGNQCSQTIDDITVQDNTPVLSAEDDFYNTDFQTPLSDNVLDNDSGLDLMLTDVGSEVGGIVSFDADGSFTFIPDPGFSGLASFTYTVTDACGTTGQAFVEIEVAMAMCEFTVEFTSTNAACGFANGNVVVTVDPPGSYFYQWSTGDSGPMLSNVSAGMYSVTIEDVNLGCSLSFDTEVGEDPAAYINNIEVLQPMCPSFPGDIRFDLSSPGGGPFDITVTLPDGLEVTFNVPAGLVSILEFVPISPGNYHIVVVDVNAGPSCVDEFDALIMEPMGLVIIVEAVIPPSMPTAMDGSIVIVTTVQGVLPYNIFLNGDSWGVALDHTFSVTGLGVGEYTVQIQDANGCFSNTVNATVPFPETLQLQIGFGLMTVPATVPELASTGSAQDVAGPVPEQSSYEKRMSVKSVLDLGLHYRLGGIDQMNYLAIYREDQRTVYRFSHLVEIGEWRYKGFDFRAHGGLSVDMTHTLPAENYWTISGSASKSIGKVFTAHATVSLRGRRSIEVPMIVMGLRMPVLGVQNLEPARMTRSVGYSQNLRAFANRN